MKMMAMRKVVFLVICLGAVSSVGWCFSEQVNGKAKDAMEAISDKDKMKDAAGAVFDKVGDAINKSSDVAGAVMDKTPDIATNAKNVAAEVANNPSDVVGKVKDKVSDIAGNTAGKVKDKVSDIAGNTPDKVSDMAGHATDTGKYTTFKVRENAIDAYTHFSSDKGGEAIYYASHTAGKENEKMAGDGKEMVKDASGKVGEKVANEKASDATGKVGAHKRDGVGEL